MKKPRLIPSVEGEKRFKISFADQMTGDRDIWGKELDAFLADLHWFNQNKMRLHVETWTVDSGYFLNMEYTEIVVQWKLVTRERVRRAVRGTTATLVAHDEVSFFDSLPTPHEFKQMTPPTGYIKRCVCGKRFDDAVHHMTEFHEFPPKGYHG